MNALLICALRQWQSLSALGGSADDDDAHEKNVQFAQKVLYVRKNRLRRTRLVSWLFRLFNLYELSESTFFSCVQLFDRVVLASVLAAQAGVVAKRLSSRSECIVLLVCLHLQTKLNKSHERFSVADALALVGTECTGKRFRSTVATVIRLAEGRIAQPNNAFEYYSALIAPLGCQKTPLLHKADYFAQTFHAGMGRGDEESSGGSSNAWKGLHSIDETVIEKTERLASLGRYFVLVDALLPPPDDNSRPYPRRFAPQTVAKAALFLASLCIWRSVTFGGTIERIFAQVTQQHEQQRQTEVIKCARQMWRYSLRSAQVPVQRIFADDKYVLERRYRAFLEAESIFRCSGSSLDSRVYSLLDSFEERNDPFEQHRASGTTFADCDAHKSAESSSSSSSSASPDTARIEWLDTLRALYKGRVIGHGGYGIVHRLANDPCAAIKCYNIDEENEASLPIDVLREINFLSILDHPNIVRLRKCILTSDLRQCAIVMPLYAEGTLADNRIPYDMADRIAKQIRRAVRYLHARRIAHRDIKPHNFMLSDDRRSVIMIDFSHATQRKATICEHSDIAKYGNKKGWWQLWTTTTAIGTPCYRPPELLDVTRYACDARALDFWGVGCVLAEMTLMPGDVRRFIFVPRYNERLAANRLRHIRNVLSGDAFWSELSERLPWLAHRLCTTCLRIEPAERVL